MYAQQRPMDCRVKPGNDEREDWNNFPHLLRSVRAIPYHAASAGRTRLAISVPFSRSTAAMSYWLCKSSQNCAIFRIMRFAAQGVLIVSYAVLIASALPRHRRAWSRRSMRDRCIGCGNRHTRGNAAWIAGSSPAMTTRKNPSAAGSLPRRRNPT
jgi:hypothetical protein